MNDDHPMNFPETVIAGVHTAVASALPCDALPVRNALFLLLSGQNIPIRALVTCSLYPEQSGIDAGTALDLIHIGLQQLHSRVDATTGASALLGTGATVLAGDYLTTGAFRLLVRCTGGQPGFGAGGSQSGTGSTFAIRPVAVAATGCAASTV